MDSRSIDFAKTASIDMMALNNKVVNMRRVVKRTKVHVISRLCKHITALKKKKGNDEQKAKNLRKAERLIEEIESIKKLKEDKVSKYALANTASFTEISKLSLLPGPRAMARLADHSLMKKIVADFREQHGDWQDLAAYLLIKQTGRRFKTKKQKQKKLSRCVENINASETMTKAYIRARFGQEGLAKAEERFERKRKRPRSAVNVDLQSKDDFENKKKEEEKAEDADFVNKDTEDRVDNQAEMQVVEKNNNIKEEAVIKQEKKNKGIDVLKADDEREFMAVKKSKCEESSESKKKHTVNGGQADKVKRTKVILENEKEESSSDDNENESTENSDTSEDETPATPEKLSDTSVADISEVVSKQRNECVVKELRLEERDDDSDEPTGSEGEDDTDSDSESSSEDDDMENVGDSKDKKMKAKRIPEFLMKANKMPISDPFFAGSDDDEEGELGEDMTGELDDSDDNVSDDDSHRNKFKAESMFYNPHSKSGGSRNSKWSHRGRGASERRVAPGSFGRGKRGGRTFDTGSRGRGSYRGLNKRFADRGDAGVRGSRFSHKDYQKPSLKDGTSGGKVAETSSREHKGPPAPDKPAKEKLHPSWEASKKRKAEQSALKAFQGSRITFDDD